MKFFLVLSLIAVAVSVREAKRARRVSVSDECQPGDCFVKDGRLCTCPKHGNVDNAECPSFPEAFISSMFGNPLSCNCNPGTVFNTGTQICKCSRRGKVSFSKCRARCVAGWCSVRNSNVCRCPDDGDMRKARCFDIRGNLNATARESEVSCHCSPGSHIQVDDWSCICPRNRELAPGNCKHDDHGSQLNIQFIP